MELTEIETILLTEILKISFTSKVKASSALASRKTNTTALYDTAEIRILVNAAHFTGIMVNASRGAESRTWARGQLKYDGITVL